MPLKYIYLILIIALWQPFSLVKKKKFRAKQFDII